MRNWLLLVSIFFSLPLWSLTIEEKKALSSQKESSSMDGLLQKVNEQLLSLRHQLSAEYARVSGLEEDQEFQEVLSRVNAIKAEMLQLENEWREAAVGDAKREEEGYALWDQEETTLAQLVMEYGAMDYLYVVPPDMANLKLTMHTNIPIPRESWSEMLEIILAQNGIGLKKLNPFTKQLYIFKQDPSAVQIIASKPQDLLFVPNTARLFYVFSPPFEQVKSVFQFFERFSDPKQTFLYQVGGKVAIVSSKEEVEKLLTLYDTVWKDPKGKVSRVVPITKMSVREMEKILHSFFGEAADKARTPFAKAEQEGLTILSPSQGNALVLLGQKELVDRAERVVKDTEDQLQDPAEMTVFLYACRHSDPAELAKILEKVYYSLLFVTPENRENLDVTYTARGTALPAGPDGYPQSAPLVVPPQTFKPEIASKVEVEHGTDHFIPDPKTGTLLMVVRRDALIKIKELLRKLDVPKKMVQIEVLLFEKRIHNRSDYGLNLLRLGSRNNGMKYEGPNPPAEGGLNAPIGRGVLEFLITAHPHHFPAFDLAYSFLMTQEDIQLNAAPSVITVNQTPATIAILEEISINNGAAPIDTNKGIAFEKSFTRAQFGITIILTPIVHAPDNESNDEEEKKGFVTLQTNITFDTTKPNPDDRPMVHKRHIENEVRVVDGQTVILGGLRRRSTQDNQEKVPFLGEIPGIGKLFGSSHLTDHTTEMFFFITPKIVVDPKEELIQIRTEELKKRPGDLPEFLKRVIEARNKERDRYFAHSMRLFFGNPNDY